MKVTLTNIGKRYTSQWIISDFSLALPHGSITGIRGINGSGKSTLLKIISGFLSPSQGKVSYHLQDKEIPREEVFNYLSLAAPYTSVIQEYTLEELVDFHASFKTFRYGLGTQDVVEAIALKTGSKRIEEFSSGMMQKVQLALAILSDTSLLLLDEPTSFLDEDNKTWYRNLLGKNLEDRTVVIASNAEEDFHYCEDIITI